MSKAMSKNQIEHMSNRIESAIKDAVEKFKKTLPEPKYLSEKQRASAIKAGQYRIQLAEDGTVPYYTNVAIKYHANETADAQAAKNSSAVDKFSAPLRARKAAIMDNAILGGADEALAALNEFIAQLAKK